MTIIHWLLLQWYVLAHGKSGTYTSVHWRKKPKCWGSILHPSVGQSKMAAVCCSKTPVSICQHTSPCVRRTKCVYFVTVDTSRLTACADSPAIHSPVTQY